MITRWMKGKKARGLGRQMGGRTDKHAERVIEARMNDYMFPAQLPSHTPATPGLWLGLWLGFQFPLARVCCKVHQYAEYAWQPVYLQNTTSQGNQPPASNSISPHGIPRVIFVFCAMEVAQNTKTTRRIRDLFYLSNFCLGWSDSLHKYTLKSDV